MVSKKQAKMIVVFAVLFLAANASAGDVVGILKMTPQPGGLAPGEAFVVDVLVRNYSDGIVAVTVSFDTDMGVSIGQKSLTLAAYSSGSVQSEAITMPAWATVGQIFYITADIPAAGGETETANNTATAHVSVTRFGEKTGIPEMPLALAALCAAVVLLFVMRR